jgi:hypothetical protein
MQFDTSVFMGMAGGLVVAGLGLIGLAFKAFGAPSPAQHQAQAELTKQALALVAQLAGAASQSVKPADKADEK